MVELTLTTVLLPLIGAIIYAGVFALKNVQAGQVLEGTKFLATLVIGVVIGVICIMTGVVPTQTDVETQLLVFAGLTAVVETVLKLIKRAVFPNGA